ncbi:MAG: DUF6527 family protein [Bacteroidota bacterium]|nr:DUF6527 family protein [Bacteroidota bacterium]MDP4257417.1 DUF6527 family protein [Bacteroidota bacterium]
MILQHKFVETIPDDVPYGWLFVSIKYKTAVHKCACGCGNEVVTPISPTDWKLTFDGLSVSLSPSIGNWNFDCRSHYWIVNNEVVESSKWSDKEIKLGRKREELRRTKFFGKHKPTRQTKKKGRWK